MAAAPLIRPSGTFSSGGEGNVAHLPPSPCLLEGEGGSAEVETAEGCCNRSTNRDISTHLHLHAILRIASLRRGWLAPLGIKTHRNRGRQRAMSPASARTTRSLDGDGGKLEAAVCNRAVGRNMPGQPSCPALPPAARPMAAGPSAAYTRPITRFRARSDGQKSRRCQPE